MTEPNDYEMTEEHRNALDIMFYAYMSVLDGMYAYAELNGISHEKMSDYVRSFFGDNAKDDYMSRMEETKND